MRKTRVVIVGGGFGGIKTALELAEDQRFDVTLLSNHDSFRYYPALYHAATGGRLAGSCIPLTNIFKNQPVTLAIGSAKTIDRRAKTITTEDGKTFGFDILVLALGVVTNYFGIKGLDKYSFGIKSTAEARRLKAHLHQQLVDDRCPDLNYIIVGAGPTGVELAGALNSYLRRIMQSHGIKHRAVHIDLVEAAPRVLPRSPKDTSRMVKRRLRRLGVRLYLGKTVNGETADELMVDNKPILSHTVIWTAGVTNHPFFEANEFKLMKNHKVATDIYLQAEKDIYVIGDNANTPYSGMAQTAISDGEFVAANLKRQLSGKYPKSYDAKQPVSIIPAGPGWAAVCWGKLRIYGRLGWWLRQAADFKAFYEYEPVADAYRQWLLEGDQEEDCPICAQANL